MSKSWNDILDQATKYSTQQEVTGKEALSQEALNEIREAEKSGEQSSARYSALMKDEKQQYEDTQAYNEKMLSAQKTGQNMSAAMSLGTIAAGKSSEIVSLAKGVGGKISDAASSVFGNSASSVSESLADTAITSGYEGGAGGVTAATTAVNDTALADLAITSGYEGGAGMGATTGSSAGSTISSVALPLAYIAGAEIMRSYFGGKNKEWDDKNWAQKQIDSPLAAGHMVSMGPLGIAGMFSSSSSVIGKAFKEVARFERQMMAPIDWLFGGKVFKLGGGTK